MWQQAPVQFACSAPGANEIYERRQGGGAAGRQAGSKLHVKLGFFLKKTTLKLVGLTMLLKSDLGQ